MKVKELGKDSGQVDLTLMLVEKNIKLSKKGTSYLELILRDVTGEIKAVIFDKINEYKNMLEPGKVYQVSGFVQEYQNTLSIKIDNIFLLKEARSDSFLPHTNKNIEAMYNEILSIVKNTGNRYAKALLSSFFTEDKEFAELFKKWPAAISMHHNYIGGLLEHTLSVTKLCISISKNYSNVDIDTLTAGALLHDIGKLREYRILPRIEQTSEGRLLGHITIGYEMVKSRIHSRLSIMSKFPSELELLVSHMILSHHGQLEWGSPVIPRTVEAQILHFADNMDAKIWGYLNNSQDTSAEPGTWSQFIKILGRQIYNPEPFEE